MVKSTVINIVALLSAWLIIFISHSCYGQGAFNDAHTESTYFHFPTNFPFVGNNVESFNPSLTITSSYDNCGVLLINDSIVEHLYISKESILEIELPLARKSAFYYDEMNLNYSLRTVYPVSAVLHYGATNQSSLSLNVDNVVASSTFSLQRPEPNRLTYLIPDAPLAERATDQVEPQGYSIIDLSVSDTVYIKLSKRAIFDTVVKIQDTIHPEYIYKNNYISITDTTSPFALIRKPLRWTLSGTTIRAQNLSFGYTYIPYATDWYSLAKLFLESKPTCIRDYTSALWLDFFNSVYIQDEVQIPFIELDALRSNYFYKKMPMQRVNLLRFVSVKDSTQVQFNGITIALLDSSKFKDTCLTFDEGYITANHAFALTQVSTIFMAIDSINPAEVPSGVLADTGMDSTQTMTRTLFRTHSWRHANTFGVDLYTRSSDTDQIKLDGAILSGNWKPFSHYPRWSHGRFYFPPGTHRIEGGQGFMAYHYGYHDNSYPYPDTVKFEAYGHRLAPLTYSWADSLEFVIQTSGNSWSPFAEFQDTLCTGDSLFVWAPKAHHTTWIWTLNGQEWARQRAGQFRAPQLSWKPIQTGSYWIKATDSSGCTASDSLLVHVSTAPEALWTYLWTAECGLPVLELNAQGAGPFRWILPDGTQRTGHSLRIEQPDFVFPAPIILIAGNTCTDSLRAFIEAPPVEVQPKVIVPNVITPNGDGQNDAFFFEAMSLFEPCFSLQIFNRWGALVFESTQISDTFQGKDRRGQVLPEGVYFYVLELGSETYRSSIQVLR